MTVHTTHETLRKSLHIGFGLFALTLRWLSWEVAAAVAAAAIIGNRVVLGRIFGARVARSARGFDGGILLYPAAVLTLIVLFRNRIEIAGTVWAILAFGDGFATLAGKAIGGPKLPWNREKSFAGLVAFIAFGFLGAEFVYLVLRTQPATIPAIAVVGLTVLVCAAVESLPLGLDDNLTVPFAGAATMTALTLAHTWPRLALGDATLWWLAANLALGAVAWAARSVNASGLLGGWVLGAIVILFAGPELYLVLLAFFAVGTAATKLGYRRKEERGLAQEEGGRRGFTHAFANAGTSTLLALTMAMLPLEYAAPLWLAAAAALATAAADTAASEIGQLAGRTTFLPLTLRRVPPGTEGAISLEGTLCGVAAGALVSCLASWVAFRRIDPQIAGLMTLAAFTGSFVESLAGSWNRTRSKPVPNGVLNFFNTVVGAAVMYGFARGI